MPDTPDLIMELNDFANHCGYFFNACMQDGIIANNGYNCSHPDQDETVCWVLPLLELSARVSAKRQRPR